MSNVEGESQKVPVSLWPDEYKTSVKGKGKGRMLAGGEERGKMRIDGGGEDEESAKEVDEAVMKGEIKIRWARTDDRKQRRVRFMYLPLLLRDERLIVLRLTSNRARIHPRSTPNTRAMPESPNSPLPQALLLLLSNTFPKTVSPRNLLPLTSSPQTMPSLQL
jgi:hypothetical protein